VNLTVADTLAADGSEAAVKLDF
jgi:hypothetical protein